MRKGESEEGREGGPLRYLSLEALWRVNQGCAAAPPRDERTPSLCLLSASVDDRREDFDPILPQIYHHVHV